VYRVAETGPVPVVVIAHGFAGSRQLMEGFALAVAQAGYIAVSYDLMGHGRNPVPMSGDVTVIDGTTTLLMDELARVSDAALALPGADGRLALVGHSMASDIVVRQAVRDSRVGAVVAVSMFSGAVTAVEPANLLVVAGAWESMLAAEAAKALQLAAPDASLGQTVGDPAAGTGRRALLAPSVEHVGVLYSRTTLTETRDWLNASFGRSGVAGAGVAGAGVAGAGVAGTGVAGTGGDFIPLRGGWIALLLIAVVALAWPLSGLLRRFRAGVPPIRLPVGRFLGAVLVPALAAPLILWPLDTRFLPVLVADYLALHFALFGVFALAMAARFGGVRRVSMAALWLVVPVALYCVILFGGALDRYVAAFWPTGGRVIVVAAMAIGAVPFMLADAVLTEAGRAPLWRVLVVRGLALASLGLAVALDFEGLFFLIIILPIILLFFLLFGTVGGWVGRATWRPEVAGVALGVFLAWALGVTFPMFAA
jgi:dienelactone hydrolase